MEMRIVRRVIVGLIFLLPGCGPMMHIPSDVSDQYDRQKSRVIPGETTRLEAHKYFGLPFINYKKLNIEIYRVASGRDADVVFAVWPVWVDTEEVIIYAMVIYDDNDIVKEIFWDTFEHVRDGYSDTSVRMAILEYEGMLFVAAKEGPGKQRKEVLLAPETISHDTIHNLPSPVNGCTVLFFYPQTDYDRVYFLDDEPIGESPLIKYYRWELNSPVSNIFVKAIVSVGEHEVRVTTFFKPSEFRRKFECQPGDIFYAYPQLSLVESEPYGFWRSRYIYEGIIRIDRGALETYVGEAYTGWRQLLLYNGKWLGED